jgi:tetratricopeptide (TPR) repeat protein
MIRRIDRGVVLVAAFASALMNLATAVGAADLGAGDPAGLRVELGITFALTGRASGADSLFVSVLSLLPRDPRALNNLGNLHLMSGDAEVAIRFYDRAAGGDPADAGIVLNRAVARLLNGDAEGARAEAHGALKKSGGMEQARSLLGIRGERIQEKEEKGAGQAALTPEEITALLDAAESSIPADTIATAQADSAGTSEPVGSSTRPPTWRSAGPRAADRGGIAAMLYWKR